ncbi:MAG: hypothetical protein ACLU4L_05395 [Anaerostipes sp.]|uniref:hypothetical protein n=1 Tax=Anaerostipes sp. TaxID=1872530 RepID=UPI00399B5CE6
MRWNKVDLPHKGWTEIGMEDLGENTEFGEEIEYEQCEMCGNEKIRYVHIMKHPDVDGELHVGCICASKMTDDYVNPEKRERDLRNRSNRRKNFMKQRWNVHPRSGNYVLRYKGENITIMRSKYGQGWGVIFRGENQWQYHGRKIYDLNTAKLVAFNLFDELHGSIDELQPYWNQERWIYR